MIKMKTGASFLVVFVIYGSLVYTDSKKTVHVTPQDCQLYAICATLKGDQNWLIFVCFVPFNNQLNV